MGIDDGKKCLKVCLTNVDKGEVPMVKKRGKEVPENNDRGVKHCQVRYPFKTVVSSLETLFPCESCISLLETVLVLLQMYFLSCKLYFNYLEAVFLLLETVFSFLETNFLSWKLYSFHVNCISPLGNSFFSLINRIFSLGSCISFLRNYIYPLSNCIFFLGNCISPPENCISSVRLSRRCTG